MKYDSPMTQKKKKNRCAMWNHHMSEVATLVNQHTPHTAYVAIDFEGMYKSSCCSLSRTTEVGVAVLPPSALAPTSTSTSAGNPPSQTERGIIRDHGVTSYSFFIKGHRPSRCARKHRESLCLFEAVWVDQNEVEARLMALLTSIPDQCKTKLDSRGGPPLSIILVGFSTGMEYNMLCSCLPGILAVVSFLRVVISRT